jgi:hypothetical protein
MPDYREGGRRAPDPVAGAVRKTASTMLLGLGLATASVLGVVFPIPALAVLARRRRVDRTELLEPAPVGLTIDLGIPVVQAWVLDLERHSRRR